jgi:hypothetical protein
MVNKTRPLFLSDASLLLRCDELMQLTYRQSLFISGGTARLVKVHVDASRTFDNNLSPWETRLRLGQQ